jgi:hypothetical protein
MFSSILTIPFTKTLILLTFINNKRFVLVGIYMIRMEEVQKDLSHFSQC